MKPGRQWIVFDANFFDNTFTRALLERFGPAGVTIFLAFLCACKMSRIPGRISWRTEDQCLEVLGLDGLKLADADGQPFTLDEYWAFTGRYKQTSRTALGQTFYCSATHWEQWQNDKKRLMAQERQRRSRAKSRRDASVTERDSDSDIYSERVTRSRKPQNPEPTEYPEWIPDEPAGEPIVSKDAIRSLLRRSTDVDG